MASLLIRDLDTVVTCDDADSRAIGPDLAVQADEVLDGSHLLCYPGLINTHHHLYQQFSRNLPEVQNLELFPWLKALYEIWKNLDTEVVHASSLTGMGELMKNGCTTCFDHHYVFPAGCGDLLGAQFAAADELGMRMVASRGSMDLSVKDGGLPPDSVVQSVDAILEDSAALIERWHDPSYGSMRQIALAPCSPFSVSRELLLQSAKLARQYHVRLHTHLAETKDEERYTLDRYGLRPLAYLGGVLEELARAENERDLSEIRAELEAGGYVRPADRRKQGKQQPSKPMHFRSSDGFDIFVGRNNRQNDQLSLKTARRDDLWLHVQKFHGTHVIIACAGIQPPDETITEAAELAAYYSEAREGQNVPVDVTPVRFLRKPNGAKPGMVVYDRYRTVLVTPDAALPARLRVE